MSAEDQNDEELLIEGDAENGDEQNLSSDQREVLTRAGDPQVTALHRNFQPVPPWYDS